MRWGVAWYPAAGQKCVSQTHYHAAPRPCCLASGMGFRLVHARTGRRSLPGEQSGGRGARRRRVGSVLRGRHARAGRDGARRGTRAGWCSSTRPSTRGTTCGWTTTPSKALPHTLPPGTSCAWQGASGVLVQVESPSPRCQTPNQHVCLAYSAPAARPASPVRHRPLQSA